jgi:hypothetical protein
VPVTLDAGVVDAETSWVGLTIPVLTEARVGAVLFVGVEADKSILVGRGMVGSGVLNGAFGVDESATTGVFSAK